MKTFASLAICAVLVLTFNSSRAAALVPQEKLIYDISWTGIKAATAVQEVSTTGSDVHIVSTTHSAAWLNAFFHVDDRAESVIPKGDGSEHIAVPRLYKEKINEGSFHTLKEAQFDCQNLKVQTKDFLKKTEKTDPISARTFDTLSSVYFIRTMDLVVGKSVFIDVYDCKRMWKTEVKVVGREEVKTPVGRFKTIVVKPILKCDGFFARTGEVTVWITDDARRIPVKMTTKVKIGKITAMLVGGSYWPKEED